MPPSSPTATDVDSILENGCTYLRRKFERQPRVTPAQTYRFQTQLPATSTLARNDDPIASLLCPDDRTTTER